VVLVHSGGMFVKMAHNILSSRPHLILDPVTAPRLLGSWEMRYLAPFMGGEVTLSEAARELHVSLPRLHYQVRKLLDEGLLQVRTVRRTRTVKVYRAVAESFYVPFELMPSESVEVALAKADSPWLDYFLQSVSQVWRDHPSRWGIRIERGSSGGIVTRVTPHPDGERDILDPDFPALQLGGWVTDLRLDHHQAKKLQLELSELLERYSSQAGSGRYLLQLRLAPMPADAAQLPRVTWR
jgi:DNA-binding Lrp family transcriptional regulator